MTVKEILRKTQQLSGPSDKQWNPTWLKLIKAVETHKAQRARQEAGEDVSERIREATAERWEKVFPDVERPELDE